MVKLSQRQQILTTILLQGMLAFLIALTIWYVPAYTTATFLFDYLYEFEFNGVDTYSWTPPSLSLTIPLERITDHVVIKQRLTAGPNYEDTRQLKVSVDFALNLRPSHDLRFDIKGREPRIYTYLLPAFGHTLSIDYLIDPLKNNLESDRRRLGFVIFNTAVDYPEESKFPSWSAITLLGLPSLSFLASVAWFGNRSNLWVLSVIVTGIVIWMYIYSPKDILLPSFPIFASLLTLTVFGIIIYRMSHQYRNWEKLTIYSLAITIVPWIYIVSGASKNIGQHWQYYQPTLWILLTIPLMAGTLIIVLKPRKNIAFAIGFLSLCSVTIWGYTNFYHYFLTYGHDFTAYYNAALRFQSNQPIYDLERAQLEYFSPYIYKYPTFFLFFILPAIRLPLEGATLVFRTFIAAATVSAILIIILSRNPLRTSFAVLSILTAINFSPLQWSIHLGQVDPILLLGISFAIVLWN